MTPINGQRTIARVTNIFKITAMAAYKEIGTPRAEPCRGAVCMATCRLPNRMVEQAAAIAARVFRTSCGKGNYRHLARRFPPPW
jgi:hypothetical protein